MNRVQSTAAFLSRKTLSEANVSFNEIMKSDDLIKEIQTFLSDKKLTDSDKRIELEDANVMLADYLTAVSYKHRSHSNFVVFKFAGNDLVAEYNDETDVVLHDAISSQYTLRELAAVADFYVYRKANFSLRVEKITSSRVLKSVESGIRIIYTPNGNQSFVSEFYNSEARNLLEELNKILK